ncbi:DUF4258 domain-containing protein [Erythrobacter crassostreae]|uniref:DUF4258 domain-containing protein n=1 Tax=Erythrobacter crassostreae TaxID=2828328 RepID=A0A9X1F3Y7_9SPHN|nr:DUF4258 domain-containing protein [Erythrobacter crassostrea]MBV7259652.1 DUF4258 domain-containing protein [Erythrobacter crassostrea]
MRQATAKTVVDFKPSAERIQQTIRAIAEKDHKVFFGPHSKRRMHERGITRLDAVRVLKKGHVDGVIVPGDKVGEWKCKITGKVKGSREIGVVTIVSNGTSIFVKTVEWEDL